MQNESISLAFTQGGSDKVYHAQLEAKGDGYTVNFSYGRRGSTLTSGSKTANPVPYDKAKKLYDSLVRSKTSKGYTESAGATPFVGTDKAGRVSGFQVQLSNAITQGEALSLINDPSWFAQEKLDGERRPVRFGTDEPVGINKKGLTVALPSCTADALKQLVMDAGQTTLDGELVGDVLHVFDITELYDADLREMPLGGRIEVLEALPFNAYVRLVPTARTTAEKRALFQRVQRENGEGVVFKRVGTIYAPGRPASYGDSRKFKFVEEATVRIARQNVDKRSVVMELQDANGNWVEVGSVTIAPSANIPPPGSVCEVRYLYAMPGGALIQPVMKATRTDNDHSDCVLAQLKFKPVPVAA